MEYFILLTETYIMENGKVTIKMDSENSTLHKMVSYSSFMWGIS